MTEIHVKVSGASAVARRTGPLVAGTVGMPVHFSFSSAWDGLNVIAVFEGAKTLSAALLGQAETTLPWEVLAESGGQLRIGAEGRKSDGSVVIPTVWANAGYIKEGAVATDEEGNPPTPGIYDQIMAAIEAGKLKGEKGEDGEQGPAGPAGPAGPQGVKGDPGHSGVYVGPGDMPDGYNVQIDPTGEAVEPDDLITKEYMQTQVLPNLLPSVTEADDGKALAVIDGAWTPLAVSIPTDKHINALIDAKLAQLPTPEAVPSYTGEVEVE